MTEIGPREKALRDLREAKYAASHKRAKPGVTKNSVTENQPVTEKPSVPVLRAAVAVAAQKRGRPRKSSKLLSAGKMRRYRERKKHGLNAGC
jgi:predicted rRNA methylase YqxC with S4 and FtsJ domains